MAVQMHVAHSSTVRGAAAIAAGPYYCAQGSLRLAFYNCMQPGWLAPLPRIDRLRKEAERRERFGDIDPLSALAGGRAWLFSGTKDAQVDLAVVQALERFYRSLGVAAVLVDEKPVGHAMPTVSAGSACGTSEPPYLNACGYDAAGALLGHLYSGLQAPAAELRGRLVAFDQRPFGAGPQISMDDTGYLYVPQSCARPGCTVHVAFHGCRQGVAQIGERFVREAGYNRWAESNRLVILYPQAIARTTWQLFNPRGCWDWWGYTGAGYHTKGGAQIRAVKAMLERLASDSRSP